MSSLKNYNNYPAILLYLSPNNQIASPYSPLTSLILNVSQLIYTIINTMSPSLTPGQVKLMLVFLVEKIYSVINQTNNISCEYMLDFIWKELLVDLSPDQLATLDKTILSLDKYPQMSKEYNAEKLLALLEHEPYYPDQEIINIIVQDLYSKIYPVTSVSNNQLQTTINIIVSLVISYARRPESVFPVMLLNYPF